MTDDDTVAMTTRIQVPVSWRALLRGHVETEVYVVSEGTAEIDVGYGEVVDDEE